MPATISVRDLRKSYGTVKAVDGVSFDVDQGEFFGILGPNGAGKTTTLEIMEGLRQADGGTVSVLGLAPWPRNPALTRTEKLSGGQAQRLSIACALVHDPEVLFLDEPTGSLDPQARRNLWDLLREISAEGRTVVLTTHHMDEAETLCDRVAIMDHGVILEDGPPTFQLTTAQVEDKSLKAIQYIAPGLLGWAIASGAAFGAAITLVTWRQNKLLRRLRLAPVSTATVVTARLGVSLAVAMVQLAVFLIILPMAFLGGAFIPLDYAPAWIRDVSYAMPLRYSSPACRT